MKEVFELQGMPDLKKHEERFSPKSPAQAVIPAAAEHRRRSGLDAAIDGKPLCMAPIAGKTLLERQADTLRSAGISDILVVGGRDAARIKAEGVRVLAKPADAPSGIVSSIMAARGGFKEKCLVVYSDVLFDRGIVEQVMKSPHPITIVIDRAFRSLPFRDKPRDLVIAADGTPANGARRLEPGHFKPVRRIGISVKPEDATCEFTGIALFQGEGLREFSRAWDAVNAGKCAAPFYDAARPENADLNDILQYIIDSGFAVRGYEIEHGWSEIHSPEDLERAKTHFEKNASPVLRVR
jgi:choline kinase